MKYRHAQQRLVLPLSSGIATAATAVVALVVDEPAPLLAAGVLALATLVLHAFSRLTTTVDDEELRVAFRWGWPRRVVPRERIIRARIVRNRWWYGWGLRVIPGATMFNVWGLDAVHLEIDGARDLRIGTDDPDGLATALGAEAQP